MSPNFSKIGTLSIQADNLSSTLMNGIFSKEFLIKLSSIKLQGVNFTRQDTLNLFKNIYYFAKTLISIDFSNCKLDFTEFENFFYFYNQS
jgi:hypothetical protein